MAAGTSPPASGAGPLGGLLLGADVGGTSTRMVLTDRDGRPLATARGGAANPNAVGVAVAAAEIGATLRRCLSLAEQDAGQIDSAVLGLAGLSSVSGSADFVAAALPGVDRQRIRLVADLAVAFASGTAEPDGSIVLSGTGAGAARVSRGDVVDRRDAWGWLLGDGGSAFWLGREAVRATLRSLQRGSELGPLGRRVLSGTGSHDLSSLLAAAYHRPPIALAELAPAVSEAAAEDPAARAITDGAADLLVAALDDLGPGAGPVVLTGSVLSTPGPVRAALLTRLDARGDRPVATASSGVAGALWLALRRLDPQPPEPARHAALVGAIEDATPV